MSVTDMDRAQQLAREFRDGAISELGLDALVGWIRGLEIEETEAEALLVGRRAAP